MVNTLDCQVRSDENHFVWLETVGALDSFLQLLKVLSHSGNDDGNILGCDGGFVDRLDGLICPITREVDPKSEVSEEAELASQFVKFRGGSSTVAEGGVSTGTGRTRV